MPAVSQAKRHKVASDPETNLNLTSMMDMFTIILVFLLKSYSATGKLITIPEGYTLPESLAETTPVVAVNVSVDSEHIIVEGEEGAIKVADVRKGFGPPYIIAPLQKALQKKAEQQRMIVEKLGKTFEGEVNIIGDKDVDFDLLIKVMATCGQSYFGKIKLLVAQKQ